ncbi:GNAT family N-acetyltransferase [Streptomyces marincola]|uniref:GNAT family N-acetyltransferase n=1 Tax=Streptomyces marincola TaxID=2878388 RepID=UPI001CF272C5|nr:GNAT family N-acetyltransferase [Streptomyces marincola]UCM88564.1 GNAT family N-acetyltransferase [Streptomyces marincola]
MDSMIAYEWRGAFDDHEVDALHAEGFGHPPAGHAWRARVERHSLGWVCARPRGDGGRADGGGTDGAGTGAPPLIGFCNVAWDGGTHAFLLDVVVTAASRRTGVATALVAAAADGARAAGCTWLHVDFEEHLRPFYLDACGLRPTPAGLLAL